MTGGLVNDERVADPIGPIDSRIYLLKCSTYLRDNQEAYFTGGFQPSPTTL
jgi:hypothetical protein